MSLPTRKSVLAAIEADIRSRLPESAERPFPVLSCKVCELDIANLNLRLHLHYHRQQAIADPPTFWYRTRRLHGHVLIPINTTGRVDEQMINDLAREFAKESAVPGNSSHLVAIAFIRENVRLMRRAGVPMRRIRYSDRSWMGGYLMPLEAYRFLYGMITSYTMTYEDFRSVYRNMAAHRRTTRRSA